MSIPSSIISLCPAMVAEGAPSIEMLMKCVQSSKVLCQSGGFQAGMGAEELDIQRIRNSDAEYSIFDPARNRHFCFQINDRSLEMGGQLMGALPVLGRSHADLVGATGDGVKLQGDIG